MTLTSLSLINGTQPAVTLNIGDPTKENQFLVKKIEGLDGDQMSPYFTGFNQDADAKFYEFITTPREIVVLIQLNPRFHLGESIKDLRDLLYRRIQPNRKGTTTILFNSGQNTLCKIDGFITKFEAPLFDKTPTVKITFYCPDRMFKGLSPVTHTSAELGSGNVKSFSDNVSTAPHGMVMTISIALALSVLNIQDREVDPEWAFSVYPEESTFQIGDIIVVSSEFGNRYVSITRAGITTYLMHRVHPDSVWPLVFDGINSYYFSTHTSFTVTSIAHTYSFWGI